MPAYGDAASVCRRVKGELCSLPNYCHNRGCINMDGKVQAIADDLQGTCQSLGEVLERHGISELTQDEHVELDGLVFCCEGCSWWCEASEANENPNGGDDVCDDCKED